MKVLMFEEEMWPVLFIRPKEQAMEPSDIKEVPKDLVDRYNASEEERRTIQSLLYEKYWEGE